MSEPDLPEEITECGVLIGVHPRYREQVERLRAHVLILAGMVPDYAVAVVSKAVAEIDAENAACGKSPTETSQ